MDKVVYRHRRLDTNEIFYVGIGKSKQRAYNKYHRSKFWKKITNKTDYSVEIISEVVTWEEACELEQFLIQEYGRRDLGTGPLVNMTDGGEGRTNVVVSDETRKKISESNKGNTYRRGKKASKEAREKMSLAQMGNTNTKGKKMSEEVKAKMSETRKGKTHSEETKAKMSETRKGFKHSDEAKQKLRDANLGKKMSEEAKLKMSKAKKGKPSPNKGKKLSEEIKAKISGKTIICAETGKIWHSISSCAIDNGLNRITLGQYLNGSLRNKTTFKYI